MCVLIRRSRCHAILNLFLAISVFITQTGCASILGDTTTPVRLNVSPDTAQVSVKDQFGTEVYRQHGPGTATLKKGRGYFKRYHYTIAASEEGYDTRIAPLDGGVSMWYALGNLLFGGLIGYLIVDPITGAMWTLDDTPPMMILNHNSTSAAQTAAPGSAQATN